MLHLLKRNISAHDTPGLRYDVYKIDYGCYVDLLSTAKSPLGLFKTDFEGDGVTWDGGLHFMKMNVPCHPCTVAAFCVN